MKSLRQSFLLQFLTRGQLSITVQDYFDQKLTFKAKHSFQSLSSKHSFFILWTVNIPFFVLGTVNIILKENILFHSLSSKYSSFHSWNSKHHFKGKHSFSFFENQTSATNVNDFKNSTVEKIKVQIWCFFIVWIFGAGIWG